VDAVDNPYAPGAGLRPPVLAGREDELAAFDAILRRGELGRVSRGLVLTGLRGVGKTVLLNEMAERAEARRWLVVQSEVRRDGAAALLGNVAAQLTAGVRRLHGPRLSEVARRALASITALTLTVDSTGVVSATVTGTARGTARGTAPGDDRAAGSGDLEVDLVQVALDVGRAAMEAGGGAVLLLDELQELDRGGMAALAAAAHVAGQRSLPFVVVGAGLPNLAGRLAEAKSYAERLFDFRRLGPLDRDVAVSALTEPSSAAGVAWAPDAVDVVAEAAGGFPYFLQEFGAACWNLADDGVVTRKDAAAGVRLGQLMLDHGFFLSRWDRATPTEREFLRAMAADGEAGRTADVARRMGRTMSNIGPIRAGLIAKGLVYAPEYGVVAFTVPGMAGFIRREAER
jgi:hypothetical protein